MAFSTTVGESSGDNLLTSRSAGATQTSASMSDNELEVPTVTVVHSPEQSNTSIVDKIYGRCRTVSSSFLSTAMQLRSEGYPYDNSSQQYFSAPLADDIPLLNVSS